MKYEYKDCKLYQDGKEVIRPEKYTDEWIKFMKLCVVDEGEEK